MKTKYVVIVTLAFLMLSSAAFLTTVNADYPNLPMTEVQLTVVDGTTSYFESTLSMVPAGFDVDNGVYPGWCIDPTVVMVRSVAHDVILYSSLSPPAALSSINWIAINYILNHKQGTMMDVQEAIWYFTDAFSPTTAAGQAMVAAANAHPSYDPTTGDVLAVICLPQDAEPAAQDSIIEIMNLEPGYTPGFWKHNIGVYLGENPGKYSAFRDGTKLTAAMLEGYAAIVGVSLEEAYEDLSARGPGMNMVRADMANAFNAAAGYGPFQD